MFNRKRIAEHEIEIRAQGRRLNEHSNSLHYHDLEIASLKRQLFALLEYLDLEARTIPQQRERVVVTPRDEYKGNDNA